MIAPEFMAELEKIRHLFEWKLVPDSNRSEERRARPRFRIRGAYRAEPEKGWFDPIGSVCYAMTGKAYGEDAWLEAAKAIELSMIDAGDITAAANDRIWKPVAERRGPDLDLQSLRERLASAVGLKI